MIEEFADKYSHTIIFNFLRVLKSISWLIFVWVCGTLFLVALQTQGQGQIKNLDKPTVTIDNKILELLHFKNTNRESVNIQINCYLNQLEMQKKIDTTEVKKICFYSPNVFTEAINDFQFFSVTSVIYEKNLSTSANLGLKESLNTKEYSLLPFQLDQQISENLKKYVYKGRLVQKLSSSEVGGPPVWQEGFIYLIFDRDSPSPLQEKFIIVGRTPYGEPFYSIP